jgi:hypothetical protein
MGSLEGLWYVVLLMSFSWRIEWFLMFFLGTGVVFFLFHNQRRVFVFFEVTFDKDVLLNELFFDAVVFFGELDEVQFISFELFEKLVLSCFGCLKFQRYVLDEGIFLLMDFIGFMFELLEILGDLFVQLSKHERGVTGFSLI